MKYLEILNSYKNSNNVAYINENSSITYNELMLFSDRLAKYIVNKLGDNDKSPIPVYGHKNILMPICFFACTKAGHAYCPMDISFTKSRVEDVLEITEAKVSFFTENLELEDSENIIMPDEIYNIINDEKFDDISSDVLNKIDDKDDVYIIFTSGSTGKPKGVRINYGNLNNYLNWINELSGNKSKVVVLNQAPFSFDLSVMDFYISMTTKSTLYTLDKKIQGDFQLLNERLINSNVSIWVSTPSFVDMCLTIKDFNSENLQNLELFLFCGEVLTKKTAEKLKTRFPNSRIYNTYGPTESTVCVTSILITDEVLKDYDILPLGDPKKGTRIEIQDSGKILNDGEIGEIVIIGDTVSPGYFKNQNQTEKSFFITKDGENAYRTGDSGFYKNGQLFFSSRMDFQIKLNGYRIELGDIESNLLKISGVEQSCVLPNYDKDNKVKSITAVVAYSNEIDINTDKTIKEELKKHIPEYMIPKKIKFVDKLPMNNNGKVDRKELKKILENN